MCSSLRIIALYFTFSLIAGCGCPSAESPEQESPRKLVLERFIVSRDNPHLLLPVEVRGKKYLFVLDTGATITTYDSSLRACLGDPIGSGTVHTPGGQMRATPYYSPAAKMGNYDLPRMSPVLCMDLSRIRKVCREEIYGALGMDFLGEHVFRIDFDRGEVMFLRSVGTDSGVPIPITFHRRIPQVQVTIPGLPGQEIFEVDTGSVGIGSGHLRAELFDLLSERDILKLGGRAQSESLSGSGIEREARLEEFSLGHFRHEQLLFCRGSKLNSLGINYLSRYVVTFDCPNGTIYLKKGRQFERTDKREQKGGRE